MANKKDEKVEYLKPGTQPAQTIPSTSTVGGTDSIMPITTTTALPSYDDLYSKYTAGLDTTAYDELVNKYTASVNENTAAQISDANERAASQLKQAYISKMQSQRELEDRLARAGIRGGATETSNLKLMSNYGAARSAINSDLASSINDINRTAAQNKLAYQLETDAKKQAYIENRQAEARQAAREDVNNAQNRADAEEQKQYERDQVARTQRIEALTSQYGKYFDLDKLKKLRAEATDDLEKQVIDARIAYLKSPEYAIEKANAKIAKKKAKKA